MTRDDFATIDVTEIVKPWLEPPRSVEWPITADFDGDVIRWKLRLMYAPQPVFFPARFVPCRCSRWRTRIARFLGRHPRTHRVPSLLVTSI